MRPNPSIDRTAFGCRSCRTLGRMTNLLRHFARIFLRCWILCAVGVEALVIALSVRGEMVDFARANTWFAFATSVLFSAAWATVPALFLAILISAVLFKRGSLRAESKSRVI